MRITVIEAIAPGKDVDGFHAVNAGRLLIGQESFLFCTLRHHGAGKARQVVLKGKHAVVVGRSNIMGKPVSLLLLREHATVTICHSRTADLGAMTRQVDVLVVAVGKPNFITGDMIGLPAPWSSTWASTGRMTSWWATWNLPRPKKWQAR